MRAQGLANAWPLSIAKHVDMIQIGRDQRHKRTAGHQGFDGAAPVTKAVAGARQADAPLMRTQDLGAEDDLMLIDKPFGAQKLPHLDGSRFAVLLALPAEPRSCEPASGRGKRASGNPADTAHVRVVFRASASGVRAA